MRVDLTATAKRNLQQLPGKMAFACAEFIHGPLAENPRRVGKVLHGELEGFLSARRGAYRIVYTVDDAAQVVTIVRIGHRGEVYRP